MTTWRMTVIFAPGQLVAPGLPLPVCLVQRKGNVRQLKAIADTWRDREYLISSLVVEKVKP